jgi:hypothetical protein
MTYLTLYGWSTRILKLAAVISLVGCATQSADQYLKPFEVGKYKTMRIEPCVDRTGQSGSRDIAAEATESLKEKIIGSSLFAINQSGELALTCDVERFAEGSAFKRWLWPGWGATKAKITVMVWEHSSQSVLAVLSSVAKVESGGLYTIGADQYIIGVAVADIVEKLNNWSQGKND